MINKVKNDAAYIFFFKLQMTPINFQFGPIIRRLQRHQPLLGGVYFTDSPLTEDNLMHSQCLTLHDKSAFTFAGSRDSVCQCVLVAGLTVMT